MTLDVQTVVAIAVPTLGAVVWLLRLEGRLNLNESRTDDLHNDIVEIKKDVKELLQRQWTPRVTDK